MTITRISTSLDKLLHDLDNLQIKRRPLQPHIIQPLSEPDKLLYATVLVTLLTNQDISDAQSRLLAMLLDSMAMTNDLQKLYANIPKLDIEQLKTFCELCDKHSLGASFLMDVLTLCRLDKALNEQQSKSLSELVSLLSLDETALLTILHLSNKVLGDMISPTAKLSETKIEELSKLKIDFDYQSLKPWHEFSYQVMTLDDLIKGITTGDWIVLEQQNVNEDIIIKNATILFAINSKININGSKSKKLSFIKNCNLINASINYNKSQKINIDNSFFLNSNLMFISVFDVDIFDCKFISYKQSDFIYNLIFDDCQKLSINNNNFTLFNSNGLFFENNERILKTNINNSKFIMSSEKKLNETNNALFFKTDTGDYIIDRCEFLGESEYNCFIRDEGHKYEKCITNSIFNCSNNNPTEGKLINRDIIYNIYICSINSNLYSIKFKNCNLSNISIYFYLASPNTVFFKSIFLDSIVYNNCTTSLRIFNDCEFKNRNNINAQNIIIAN